MGYHLAGYDVIGVDSRPQPRYPFPFIQADALDFLASEKLDGFDLIHASPPCQRFSAATPAAARERHPNLVEPIRLLLRASGQPYVIENVVGAPLIEPVVLCGLMFGLRVFRHRLFECSQFILSLSHASHGSYRIGEGGMTTVVDGGCARPWAMRIGVNGYVTVAGGGNFGLRDRAGGRMIRHRPEDGVNGWRRAMGIDWMTRDELAQAIPPAYTQWLAEQLR